MAIKVLLSLNLLTLTKFAVASYFKIGYGYTLWIGDNVDEKQYIQLNYVNGTKFIDSMNQAAAKDPAHYSFEFIQYSIGKFITVIGGNSQNSTKNLYWMLYDLNDKPKPENKPGKEYLSPVGVDLLEVKNKHQYLFWLKTVTGDNHD